MGKKLKIYNKDGNINEEIVDFCHKNFVIQNLKKELMREFSPICSKKIKFIQKYVITEIIKITEMKYHYLSYVIYVWYVSLTILISYV